MSKEQLVRVSLSNRKQKDQRTQDVHTDWDRFRSISEEELEEAIRDDPDSEPPVDDDAWAKAELVTRKQANEIAKVLTPKFEGMLWDPPIGKRFQDCYDLKTLKPTQEWLDIYLKVKRELIELGIPL